jgi:hypothetical protein
MSFRSNLCKLRHVFDVILIRHYTVIFAPHSDDDTRKIWLAIFLHPFHAKQFSYLRHYVSVRDNIVQFNGMALSMLTLNTKFTTRKFWPNQYSETNVMHFVFSLLRIKGLYMFRALLAHPQEALHKRHLVYCVYCAAQTALGVLSAYNVSWLCHDCSLTDIISTQYTKCRLCSAS